MHEQTLKFVNQLREKTAQGKIPWTTGVFDGQFKAILPGEGLAFVVQVKKRADGQIVHKFQLLDDHQEEILNDIISAGYIKDLPNGSSDFTPSFHYWDGEGKIDPQYAPEEQRVQLFNAIGELQDKARAQALQVNQKLQKAEALLASI
jgi:hypothetical protein